MKIYTVSGRKTKDVIDSTIDILIGKYQVDKEFMDKDEQIDCLENIIDLTIIKKHLY